MKDKLSTNLLNRVLDARFMKLKKKKLDSNFINKNHLYIHN